MSVYFGGSRSLGVAPMPILSKVLHSVLAGRQAVHVGCCIGADQQVIYSALGSVGAVRSSSFQQVRVFAAFGQAGAGACGVSAVSAVSSWSAAGGAVSWLAGGSLVLPLAARLIRRSLAALAGCSAAVFFQPGAGSLAVAAHAVAAGVPVFAFSQSAPAGVPGQAGAWLLSSFSGFSCWSFQPAQAALF